MATAFEGQGPAVMRWPSPPHTPRRAMRPGGWVPIARCGSRPHGPCCRPLSGRAAAQTKPPDEEHTTVADKSPRQHQSKKSGKSLKEKRTEKKGKQATKRLGS